MRLLCTIILLFIAICGFAQAPVVGSLTQEDGLMCNSISYIFRDSRQLMYFGSYKGIDRYDGARILNIPFQGFVGKESDRVTDIVEDGSGNLLVGTTNGLWLLDNGKLTLDRCYEKEIDCPVYGMWKTKDGIYVHTKFGNWLIKGKDIVRTSAKYPKPKLPLSAQRYNNWGRFDDCYSTYTSPDGVRWVGYKFFGVDYTYYNRGIFKIFANNGFSSRGMRVRNFLKDGNRMFLGTRNGLYIVDGRGVNRMDANTLGAKIITQIAALSGSDKYLVATIGGGIKIIDVSALRVTGTLMPLANVYQMKRDGENNIWFCTSCGLGKYSLATNKLQIFDSHNSQLPSDEVFCIGFDVKGNGWVSTAGGICQYHGKEKYIDVGSITKKVKALGPMRDIYAYSKTGILFILQHGKPYVYEAGEDKLNAINLDTGTDEPSFLYVKDLGKGRWIYATSDGIYYRSTNGQMRKFGYIDGLPNMQFQSHGISVDGSGVVWAATNEGLVYARLNDIVNHRYGHHDIVLDEIQTDHRFSDVDVNDVFMNKTLRLNRVSNDLTIHLSPVIYGNTRSMSFRYRLENGNDTTWRIAGHERIISFSHLAAGNYRLRVEVVGMPEISTEIKVIVPFTYQAIALFIVIILALAFAGYVVYCKKTKTEYFWKKFMPRPEKYQRSHIDASEAKKLQKAVIKYMDEKKPYLNPNFQMSDLAKALSCSSHELSQVFSQYLQRNYYDFIAEYRINEFKRLAADPKYSKYTITALSEQCGFRSRTPFLTAFKKFTGVTPKEYMQNQKRSALSN